MGLWDLALLDRRQAFHLSEPARAIEWWWRAALMVQQNDQDGYRRLCARMGERFSGYRDENAIVCIRAACLLPGIVMDYGRAEELLQATSTDDGNPLSLYVQGLVQLRAGEFDLAESSCLESLKRGADWNERALNYPVLALATGKRGAATDARAYLDRATTAKESLIHELYASGDRNWIGDKGVSAAWRISPTAWLEFDHLYGEARSELHQPPATNDVRQVVLRARALAAIGRSEAADASYQAAVALDPANQSVRAERHRCEAYRRMKEGDFLGGADEFAAAIKTDPADVRLWVNSAHAHLAAGRIEEYRGNCRELLRRFRDTTNPADADLVVWSCVACPDSIQSMEELLPLADLAATDSPGAARTRAAALTRAGRYEDALRDFNKAARFNIPHPSVMCLQAIAYYRLGQLTRRKSAWTPRVAGSRRPTAGRFLISICPSRAGAISSGTTIRKPCILSTKRAGCLPIRRGFLLRTNRGLSRSGWRALSPNDEVHPVFDGIPTIRGNLADRGVRSGRQRLLEEWGRALNLTPHRDAVCLGRCQAAAGDLPIAKLFRWFRSASGGAPASAPRRPDRISPSKPINHSSNS